MMVNKIGGRYARVHTSIHSGIYSVPIYVHTNTSTSLRKLRLGQKCFRTTAYDWDRPAKKDDKGKGKGKGRGRERV